MNDFYNVLELQFDSPETYEQLGSKEKFWFRSVSDSKLWLFKFPREKTGEAWAEKIVAEIAEIIKIPHAVVELAVFSGKKGSVTPSFVDREKGFELTHGSEVLSGIISGYDKTLTWLQKAHSLKNIFNAIGSIVDINIKNSQLEQMAGYIVLDGLVCNTDRHHDNWGLIKEPMSNGSIRHVLAPTYDHASSLGRELQDHRREIYLGNNRVEEYVFSGHGGIWLDEQNPKGENPLKLVNEAIRIFPDYFKPWIYKLKSLKIEDFNVIIQRIPDDWMSLTAKKFANALLPITLKYLRSLT